MKARRAARLRAALLGGGVAALGVCLLAALHLGRAERWGMAALFAAPWGLFAIFLLAPSRPERADSRDITVPGQD